MIIDKGYFSDISATTLSDDIAKGRTTSTDLVKEALAAIDALNPKLNAFTHVDREGALSIAARLDEELSQGINRGRLHGLPVALKDNIDTAGVPTTYGSHFYAHHVPDKDAALVESLKEAGAVIIGKTLTSEFALGPTGEFSYQGACRNPHNTNHVSGGSSAGSAVSVAAGMVPLAIGTDTAGSVRIPAAFCGIVGFKPSFGSISTQGVFPVSDTLDHIGPMAKTVDDVALLVDALVGSSNQDHKGPERSNVRIGWVDTSALIEVTPGIADGCKKLAVELFGENQIHPFSIDEVNAKARAIFKTVFLSEAYEIHRERMSHIPNEFSPEQHDRLSPGAQIGAWEYVRAKRNSAALIKETAKVFADYDLLALPTIAITAPGFARPDTTINGVTYSTRDAINTLTSVWSLLGFPTISIPAGELDGMPFGLQVVAAPGKDKWLLELLKGR